MGIRHGSRPQFPIRAAREYAPGTWVRPIDWLPITKPGLTEEKIILLCAVWADGDNALAVQVTVSSGTYTVDWGDGSTPTTHTSNTQADHTLDYSALAGTESSRGYRQCRVTITPTTGGATISSANPLVRKPTGWSASTAPPVSVLEAYCSLPAATAPSGIFDGNSVVISTLENVWFNLPAATTLSYLCRSQATVRRVEFVQLPASYVANSVLFQGCTSLVDFITPLGISEFLSRATILGTVFSGCSALRFSDTLTFSLSNINASAGLANCFFGCTNIAKRIEITGTWPAALTNVQTLFYGITGLHSVSLPSVPSTATTFSQTFAYCPSLREVVLTGTMSGVTSISGLFTSTLGLRRCVLPGLRIGFSVAQNRLSATALDEMFTALGTANGTQSVTITGNPGVGTCDTTIATGKGWTVVN